MPRTWCPRRSPGCCRRAPARRRAGDGVPAVPAHERAQRLLRPDPQGQAPRRDRRGARGPGPGAGGGRRRRRTTPSAGWRRRRSPRCRSAGSSCCGTPRWRAGARPRSGPSSAWPRTRSPPSRTVPGRACARPTSTPTSRPDRRPAAPRRCRSWARTYETTCPTATARRSRSTWRTANAARPSWSSCKRPASRLRVALIPIMAGIPAAAYLSGIGAGGAGGLGGLGQPGRAALQGARPGRPGRRDARCRRRGRCAGGRVRWPSAQAVTGGNGDHDG